MDEIDVKEIKENDYIVMDNRIYKIKDVCLYKTECQPILWIWLLGTDINTGIDRYRYYLYHDKIKILNVLYIDKRKLWICLPDGTIDNIILTRND